MIRAAFIFLLTALYIVSGITPCAAFPQRTGHPVKDPNNPEVTLQFGGRERWAILHVPKSYRPGVAAPVVLVFHGGGGFPDAIRFQSKMDELSDREGFIAVYPAGSGILDRSMLTFNAGSCCGYAVKHNVDDIGFISALLDKLALTYTIDHRRIYSTGLSNGAMMSYRLACELSDRIAAIAPVAATIGVERCSPKRPIPLIHFHGQKDQNALYNGGRGPKSISQVNMKPVFDTVKMWAKMNECAMSPTSSTRGAARETRFGACRAGAHVVLWTLTDGGHSWPGGEISHIEEWYGLGTVNRDISASELMWEFFKDHPRPN